MKNFVLGMGLLVLLGVSSAAHATTEWNAQEYDLYAGDFNGDGYTDILYIAKDPSMPSGIALSDSSGTPHIAWQSWESNFLGLNWSGNAYNVIIGDFNGDGKSDILLQGTAPNSDSFLLLTSSAGLITGVSQHIANNTMGLIWSADQHHIIAGAFSIVGTKPRFGLFLQATSRSGTDAIVLTDANGQFSASAPSQTWTDGFAGLNWSTQSANVFAGDFNGDGTADLLVQAKPQFVMIDYDVSFPVPTYKPNMNGVVLGTPVAIGRTGTSYDSFSSTGTQLWSRMSNGVDWSPLTNTVVVVGTSTGKSTVVLQGRYSGRTSYELIGNATGAIFPATATALTSNVSLTSDSYRLIAGNFGKSSTGGLYYQALTAGGANYLTDGIGTGGSITASLQNPSTVTGTVEPTSAGRTAGQFSITPTGAATYNIPIWTPPGARDIEPHLALHYTSGGPDSVMGPGWSLTGMSAIVRCGKTWASTGGTATTLGSPAAVSLAASDDLCLDGNRLRLTSGTQGMGASTYMTELAEFSLITANGTAASPATSFTVQGKDGHYYEYGNTATSAYSQVSASGAPAPYVWALDKVSDRQGNSMVFSYNAGFTTLSLNAIQYTATAAAPTTYWYTVSFAYASSRTGGTSLTKYVAGGQVTQSTQLTTIKITSAVNSANALTPTLVRQYNLGYSASPTTNRPLLSSVQECGGTSGTDCLRPTTITYQAGGAGWSTAAVPTGLTAQYGFVPVDLNGDGIPDALYADSSGHWWARLGTTSGYGSTVYDTTANTTSGQTILPGMFSGKGGMQFLAPVGSVWWIYTFNGSGFSSANTGVQVSANTFAADYDGDGLPDLITISGTIVNVNRNITTVGGAVAFASSATVYIAPGYFIWQSYGTNPNSVADFNGDGRADVLFSATCVTKQCIDQTDAVLSTGTSGSGIISSGFTSGVPGDWNGDGCTDIIAATVVYISDCAGGFTSILTGAPNATATAPIAVDWDGDGQTDLVYRDTATNQLYLVRSTGGGAAAPVPLGISAPATSTFFAVDQNSDGQPELMVIDAANGYAVSYYPHNGFDTPPDLASAIADGFGINFSPTYVPISQSNYTKGSTAVFPDEDFKAPMYVVNQFMASDGTGGTYQTTFTYAGARLNLQGRGFEGFATTTAIDNRLNYNLVHSTAYSQSFPTIGAVLEDDVFQSGGTVPISKTSNAYHVAQLSSPSSGYTMPGSSGTAAACPVSCFAYVNATTINKYELGGTKNGAWVSNANTQYTYDAYGSLANTNSVVTDEDTTAPASPFAGQQWSTVIHNTIYNNGAANVWCLGRPTITTTQKTAPGQPALTRTVNHTMDPSTGGASNVAYGNCRAQYEIVEPNDTLLKVTTTFGFDSCGNTNSVSVVGLDETGAAMPARTTTTNYSYYTSRCQFPEFVSNPLSQPSYMQYRYDLGVKQMATDANNVSVSWLYDDFARKTKETRPDSTATTWSYADCVSPSCWGTADLRFQTTETLFNSAGAAIRVHEAFSDGLDRVRYNEGNRVLGVWSTQVTSYDALGRKHEVDLPYSSSSNGYHIYTYDAGNRPLTDTLYTPAGTQYRQISMGYLGQTATVKDPNGNTITKVTDVAGKLRWVTDPPEGVHGAAAGTTKYTYDSFDDLITIVDAIGATSSYTYNIRGFKVGSADADAGTWVFQPDSLNELKIQTDANHAITKFTYDLLGRMLTRLEPESSTATSWVYGTSAALHEIGQLHSVSKPDGYAEGYAYDNVGRPQTRTYTEDGTIYQFDYAYNTLGAPDTLTYPVSTSGVRFQLKYLYDTAGYLNEVQDASAGTPFWTLTGVSDNSAPTMEVLGNAVSVATGYTPWTNEMISRTEGSAGSTTNLQNLSYSWDLNGNLLQRVDSRQNLTEAFTLDALNRLSTVKLNGFQTLSVQYDQAGDIINKSDVSSTNYTYGNAAHPHAVTQAGSWAIGYDANGNMNSRAGGAITSYSYNLPNQINYNGSSSQFNYDSSHQRWKQVANYAGTTETIHYVGGLLQVVTRGTSPTEYRHQIPAGSSTAVYTRRSDGTTGTYYATSDHLGSADLVMDSAANVLVRESFTPFGARRGSNWQSIPSTADYTQIQSTTRQGFTGHEMLDSVGLIHMNGRVYDPTLGRFLSADSVIQSLGATQSINPYSYAWNDPLRFTDSSGHSMDEFWNIATAVVGIVVAILVYLYTGPIYGSQVLQAAFAGFAGGFVGGALSTGTLSGALTAGLISGVTAALFAEVGTIGQNQQWDIGARVLAHAAVGCVSGQLSSGNCGRGAISAAVSEYLGSQVLHGNEMASWGSTEMFAQTAKYALIGGITSEITGGNFKEGFSIGAAGYLFNRAAHPKPVALYTSTSGYATEDDAAKAAYAMAATYKDSGIVEYGGVIFKDGAGYEFTVFRGNATSVAFTLHSGTVDWWHIHPADPLCEQCNTLNENLSPGDIGQEKFMQSKLNSSIGAYLLTPTNVLKFFPFPLDRSNSFGYRLPYP